MIRAFVGAGGKTTRIYQQAGQFLAQGKRVFVTTSTHMFIEENTLLTDDAEAIVKELDSIGYAMAGIPAGGKICPLSPETYERVCACADVVLVEADGSNRMPIKFPKDTEPVIYENVEEIEVVCGLHAMGRPLREVAHRPELVKRCLDASDDTIITLTHIRKLVREGYLLPLRQKYPRVFLSVFPAGGTEAEARELLRGLEEEGCL